MDGQTRSTLCQSTDEHIALGATPVLRLVGCGIGYPDNLLWHLDRADSRTGVLDGSAYVPATGAGVVVYVIDLRIREDHVEFARPTGDVILEQLTVSRALPSGCGAGSSFCDIVSSHGTAVASLIAGQTIGLAPDARIVGVITGPSDYRQAFRAIVQHAFAPTTPSFRTAIVSISGGYTASFTDLEGLAEDVRRMTTGVDVNMNPDANGKRFVMVVAAGNSVTLSGDPINCSVDGTLTAYPGRFGREIDGLITVGALTRENTVWEGSCGGSAVEVLAPGANVLAASGTGVDHYIQPAHLSGTSFSTPWVTGMAARLLERDPDATPAEIEARLKASPSMVSGLPVPVMAPLAKRRAVR